MQSSSLYDTRDYINNYGLSRTAIFNQVDASLARLDTPYIDLLQIHRSDLDNTSAEETMKALHDLVASGKVRYIGASSMWAWQLAHYNHVAEKVRFHPSDNWYVSLKYVVSFRMAGQNLCQCKTTTPSSIAKKSAK